MSMPLLKRAVVPLAAATAVKEVFLSFLAGTQLNAPEKAMNGAAVVNPDQEKEAGIILKRKKCYILT